MEEQRRRIISDIASWKNESTEGRITDDELQRYIDQVTDLGDEELENWWRGTVGEWVASRMDTDHPDAEFKRLVNGEETGYGYLQEVQLPGPE